MSVKTPPPNLLSQHRRSALADTLTYIARESPFYRGFLKGIAISSDNSEKILRTIPSLSSSEWQQLRSQIRVTSKARIVEEGIDGIALGYTGGTTGTPKPYFSIPEERSAFGQVIEARAGTAVRTLNLFNMYHALPSHGDDDSKTMSIPFFFPEHHLPLVGSILERREPPYSEMPPFRAISGSVTALCILTVYLMEQRGRVDDLGVAQLVVNHTPSPRWRRILQDWWGAEIVQLYGLSEIRMCNSIMCTECDHYHLPPTCVGEILAPDADEGADISDRHGVLTVTVFYPFISFEPRIRYRTGDLVEISEAPCPRWGEHGFRLLGRADQAAKLDSGFWLTPMDCYMTLSDIADVARSIPHMSYIRGGDERYQEAGAPRFRIDVNPAEVNLNVELRYDPLVWPDRCSIVSRKISSALLLDEQPGVKIIFHRPNTLGVRTRTLRSNTNVRMRETLSGCMLIFMRAVDHDLAYVACLAMNTLVHTGEDAPGWSIVSE